MSAAYALFSRRGVRAVGIEELIAKANVAKATLYRNFPSKQDLVLAFLAEYEQRWTIDFVRQRSERRGDTAEERLLAIFDVLHDWFTRPEDFDGCSFITVLLELGPEHPAGQACLRYLDNIRAVVRDRAAQAGCATPNSSPWPGRSCWKAPSCKPLEATCWPRTAHRAQGMARLLIEQHRAELPRG